MNNCVIPTGVACSGVSWSANGTEPCNPCSCDYCTGSSAADRKSCLCVVGSTWLNDSCNGDE